MPIQPFVVLSSASGNATKKTRRSLRSIEESHSATRQVIVSTDVNTTGDAETRRRSGLGCCHFHSFTFFSLLVIYSYFVSPTKAKPFSLVGGTEDINGIQGSNRLAEIWTKQGSSAVNPIFLQLPLISSQTQRLMEQQQQLQQRLKFFSEKTHLYQDEPKVKHYPYVDQEEATVPEEDLSHSANAELATAASAELTTEAETEYMDNMGQITTDAATATSSAKTDHIVTNGDGITNTASERSPRKYEEKLSSVTLVNEDNTAEMSPGKIHTSSMIASVPIRFQAKPFVVSPAIAPEINDQIAPQRPPPIPSLLEEIGPLF